MSCRLGQGCARFASPCRPAPDALLAAPTFKDTVSDSDSHEDQNVDTSDASFCEVDKADAEMSDLALLINSTTWFARGSTLDTQLRIGALSSFASRGLRNSGKIGYFLKVTAPGYRGLGSGHSWRTTGLPVAEHEFFALRALNQPTKSSSSTTASSSSLGGDGLCVCCFPRVYSFFPEVPVSLLSEVGGRGVANSNPTAGGGGTNQRKQVLLERSPESLAADARLDAPWSGVVMEDIGHPLATLWDVARFIAKKNLILKCILFL